MNPTPVPTSLPATWTVPPAPPKATGLALSPLPHTGAAASVLRDVWGPMSAFDNPDGVFLAFDGPQAARTPWGKALGDTPTVHDLGDGIGIVVGPAGEALAFAPEGAHSVLIPIPLRCHTAPNAATKAWLARAPRKASAIGRGIFPVWGTIVPQNLDGHHATLFAISEKILAIADLSNLPDFVMEGVRFASVDTWTTRHPAEPYWGFQPITNLRIAAARHLLAWTCAPLFATLPIWQGYGNMRVIGQVYDTPATPNTSAHTRLDIHHRHAADLAQARASWRRFFPDMDATLGAWS